MPLACANHPDEPASASCARCGQPLCADCAYPSDGQTFCRADYLSSAIAPFSGQGLVEDYQGPMTNPATVVASPPVTFAPGLRWPDEPSSSHVPAARIAAPPRPPIAILTPPPLPSSPPARRDPILERALLGLLLPIVAVGVAPVMLMPVLLIGSLVRSLLVWVLRWGVALPAVALILAGMFHSVWALSHLRHSSRTFVTTLISIIALVIAAALLWLTYLIATGSIMAN